MKYSRLVQVWCVLLLAFGCGEAQTKLATTRNSSCTVPRLKRDDHLNFILEKLKERDPATLDLVVDDLLYWLGLDSDEFFDVMAKDTVAFDEFLSSMRSTKFRVHGDESASSLKREIEVMQLVWGNEFLGDTIHLDMKRRFLSELEAAKVIRNDSISVNGGGVVLKRIGYLITLFQDSRGEEILGIVDKLFQLVIRHPNEVYCFFHGSPETFSLFLENLEQSCFTNQTDTSTIQLESQRLNALEALSKSHIDSLYVAMHEQLIEYLGELRPTFID